MASPSSSRKGTRSKAARAAPLKDRRTAPDANNAAASLRKLKGLLGRPIGLERRDGKLKVVLTERRRARPADELTSLALLCGELSALLLAHEANEAAQTMRHLILVHDALKCKGWAGVEGMSALVLRRALSQADMLARDEPSPHLQMLIEGLRPLHTAAELRDRRDAPSDDLRLGENLEVTESDYTEFEDAEHSWSSGTMPADLVPPARDRDD